LNLDLYISFHQFKHKLKKHRDFNDIKLSLVEDGALGP